MPKRNEGRHQIHRAYQVRHLRRWNMGEGGDNRMHALPQWHVQYQVISRFGVRLYRMHTWAIFCQSGRELVGNMRAMPRRDIHRVGYKFELCELPQGYFQCLYWSVEEVDVQWLPVGNVWR